MRLVWRLSWFCVTNCVTVLQLHCHPLWLSMNSLVVCLHAGEKIHRCPRLTPCITRRWYTLWFTVAHLCQRCNSIGLRTTPGVILRPTQSHLCLRSLWDSVIQDCSVGLLKSVTSRPIRGPTVITQLCYSNGGSSNSIDRTKWDNFGKSGSFSEIRPNQQYWLGRRVSKFQYVSPNTLAK